LINFKQGYVDSHQTLIIEYNGITFQRLIDYTGKDKTRLTSYKSKVFGTASAPDSNIVFVTEGVLNAISFEQSWHAAIATYSSGSVPESYYQANKHMTFVLAFDNDKADIKGIQKTIDCFKKLGITAYKIALVPKKINTGTIYLLMGNLITTTSKKHLRRLIGEVN
jgi:hypothetical protein